MGAQGYALYKAFTGHKTENGNDKSHIFIKQKDSPNTYSYKAVDIDNKYVNEHYLLIYKAITDQAKLGYVFKTRYNLGINKSKLIFVKNVKSTQVFNYDHRFLQVGTTNKDMKLSHLNEMGAKNCKFIYMHSAYTNNGVKNAEYDIPTCLKVQSSTATYSYRWIEQPQVNGFYRPTPEYLAQLLKDQAKAGYHIIDNDNALLLFNRKGYLFEKDSSDNTARLDYKVQSEFVLLGSNSKDANYYRLQDQAKLGWFLGVDNVYSNVPSYFAFTYTGQYNPQ